MRFPIRVSKPAALVVGLGLMVAAAASAEVRRIEEVGAVSIRSGARGGDARDAAMQAALQQAVLRVARSFLMESDQPAAGDIDDAALEAVLGKRMVPYTSKFRVLEDRGERPAMFAEKGAATEYVVVVEVHVEADRVEQRLMDEGLLARDPLAGTVSRVILELRGVEAYGAVAAVRELLVERLGATSAVPKSFERSVAVIEVELPGASADAPGLTEQMAAQGPPVLLLRPVEVDDMSAVLDVTWRPEKAAGAAGRRR